MAKNKKKNPIRELADYVGANIPSQKISLREALAFDLVLSPKKKKEKKPF